MTFDDCDDIKEMIIDSLGNDVDENGRGLAEKLAEMLLSIVNIGVTSVVTAFLKILLLCGLILKLWWKLQVNNVLQIKAWRNTKRSVLETGYSWTQGGNDFATDWLEREFERPEIEIDRERGYAGFHLPICLTFVR